MALIDDFTPEQIQELANNSRSLAELREKIGYILYTESNFSAFILLIVAIRDNVSDTSNLHSELISQTETPISVSLSLVRQVISKELLRYMFK